MTRRSGTARGLLAALVAVSALAGCTDSGPDPEDTAEALEEALSSGELPAELFTEGSPQEEYDEVVAGLEELDRRVELEEVATDETDDTTTATYTWSWTVGDQEWTYQTQAPLTEGEESWTADWAPSLVEPSLETGETLDVTRTAADRGQITGAGGDVLVRDRPVVRIGIDKTLLRRPQLAESARSLAATVDIAPRPYVELVGNAGPDAFVEGLVLRQEEASDVTGGLAAIPGARAIDDTLALAPTREFAAPILGRVGPATAELVEESDGRLRAGDETGLSGLQLRYDEQLSGTPGAEITADSEDGESRTLFETEPEAGEPLATTLDTQLQRRAEQVLAGGPDPASALVAIRPSDGAVLAAASGPGADGVNVATYGQYAPGSTFKVVSTLALLRSGMGPEGRLECPSEVVVDGKSFENYDDYPGDRIGSVTLRQALAYSCNTAFINGRERLGEGDLADAAASLGFGVDQDLGFPSYFGQVPPPESETEAAADLIGQGKVLASPLTMATVAASVQSGRTVVPYLLEDHRPEAAPDNPLTGREAGALRSMMGAVVSEGSGTSLQGLADGAKTGTAEYGEADANGSLETHAWMIAFRGDLAVAAFVETGESGSSTAGPLLAAFLRG
jgi:cell division protein FtsI/penicillin-binding protein 2